MNDTELVTPVSEDKLFVYVSEMRGDRSHQVRSK